MTDSLALGLNFAVLGFFLAVVPLLPKHRTWARSLVVLVALGLSVRYLWWRWTATAPPVPTPWLNFFFDAGLTIELMMFLTMTIFFVTLSRTVNRSAEADRYEKWLRSLPPERLPTVDVFLPTYNEGREFVERGIVAAKALDYPRFRVWVLDDGRRDWVRDLCAAKGVEYLRRPDNKHAKAGNINHALSVTEGELFVVFDADFTPRRNFLYRTIGFFYADPRVTIVQTPQHFYNPDIFQVNLKLAGVMQDNEREWFDVILACRDAWDCAFCCGTSAVLRRDAIQSVGGVATETITEDIHTTVKMFPSGYRTRYLNERLSMGVAPESAKSLAIQRQRWARGTIQLFVLMIRDLGTKLSFRQWLFFTPFHYFFDFPCRLLFALLPLVYLWTGFSHFCVNSTAELVAYQGPAIVSCFWLLRWLIPQARIPLLTPAISLYLSARTFPAIVGSLIKPFGTPFRVTPKGRGGNAQGDPAAICALIVLIGLTAGGIVVGCHSAGQFRSQSGLLIATCWALCNLVLFGMTILTISQRPQLRGESRFAIGRPAELVARGRTRNCLVIDMSLTGGLLGGAGDLEVGETVRLSVGEVGVLPGRVVRKTADGRVGVDFAEVPEAVREKLIVYLYTTDFRNDVGEVRPGRVLWRVLMGAIDDAA